MKRCLMLIIAMAMAMVFALPVLAADYSAYSTEELAAMRGTMASSTEEERQSFRNEWQQRISSMSVDERRQYVGRPANASGNGQGCKRGYGSDSGSQNYLGNRERHGQGYGRRKK